MEVLQSIGYRGVPSKESWTTRDELIRYVSTQSYSAVYRGHGFIHISIFGQISVVVLESGLGLESGFEGMTRT